MHQFVDAVVRSIGELERESWFVPFPVGERRHHLKRAALLCLLLATFSFGNLRQVSAPPVLQSKIVQTAQISGNIYAVDVTSNGTVFANVDSDVYRSVDYGESWTKVLDRPSGFVYFLRVDSQDRIFAAAYNSTGGSWHNDIYLSTDYGVSWNLVLGAIPKVWRLTEMLNGSLLMNTYATGQDALIYKSDDGGSMWSNWQNLTSWNNNHIHFVRINPYNNDIWVGLGDKSLANVPTLARSEDGGSTWTFVYNTTIDWMYTDVVFDRNYAYLMPDRNAFKIQRLPHRGSWTDRTDVFDIYADDATSPTGIPFSMMSAVYDDGLMVVPTDRETVLASVDGVRWLKIFQTTYEGSGAWRFDYISQRRDVNGYWYFLSDYDNIIYRASISVNDVKQQFWSLYNEYLGNVGTEQMLMPAENDTGFCFNISQPFGTRLIVSAVGLAKGNFVSNPSFETGDLTGWSVGGVAAGYGVTTTDSYDGSYSLIINKTTKDGDNFWVETPLPVDVYDYAEYWFASTQAKTNRTLIGFRIEVGYYLNGTWATVGTAYSGSQSTSWARRTTPAQRSTVPRKIYARFIALQNLNYNYTMYLDNILFERKVGNRVINKVDNGDTIVYKAGKTAPTASTSIYGYTETQNVNITISGYGNLVHPGNLSEGSTINQSFWLTRQVVDFHVKVDGSKQLLLIITYGTGDFLAPEVSLSQLPLYPLPRQPVKVYANVTEPEKASGVKDVFFSYRVNGASWFNTTMVFNQQLGLYEVTIPQQQKGEVIEYFVKAVDNAGNVNTTEITSYLILAGDVDRNGNVDAHDIFIIAKAFGTIVGEPQYVQEADITRDGAIGTPDLAIVSMQYGEN